MQKGRKGLCGLRLHGTCRKESLFCVLALLLGGGVLVLEQLVSSSKQIAGSNSMLNLLMVQ